MSNMETILELTVSYLPQFTAANTTDAEIL